MTVTLKYNCFLDLAHSWIVFVAQQIVTLEPLLSSVLVTQQIRDGIAVNLFFNCLHARKKETVATFPRFSNILREG